MFIIFPAIIAYLICPLFLVSHALHVPHLLVYSNLNVNDICLALEIWDALRAAAEADLSLAQAIVDSAGVIVQSADLTICYDERGKPSSALLSD